MKQVVTRVTDGLVTALRVRVRARVRGNTTMRHMCHTC